VCSACRRDPRSCYACAAGRRKRQGLCPIRVRISDVRIRILPLPLREGVGGRGRCERTPDQTPPPPPPPPPPGGGAGRLPPPLSSPPPPQRAARCPRPPASPRLPSAS